MIAKKHITKFAAVLMIIAAILCVVCMVFHDTLSDILSDVNSSVSMEYADELFDTSQILSVDIQMDAEDWQQMIDNAIEEEYYACDVVINGTTFKNVGIRPKGNTSLSTIVNDDTTERYSFKIKFDEYVDGQTCFGLDKLVLNNNYADATSMREAFVYDMFQTLDAPASLYNYADISVNGETWGLYLALEAVEESFLLRNFGTSYGSLYKPDNLGGGGGGGNDSSEKGGMGGGMMQAFGDMSEKTVGEILEMTGMTEADFLAALSLDAAQFSSLSDMTAEDFLTQTNLTMEEVLRKFMGGMRGGKPEANADSQAQTTEQAPTENANFGGGMGGGFDSSSATTLNYIDENLDSYSDIWQSEINKTTEEDHQKVVTALENISEKNNVSDYMDVDNMLKYLAVHSFSVNLDSLSGNMPHNYYLYEQEGKITLLPWDYNLAFGGMGGMGGRGGMQQTETTETEQPAETTEQAPPEESTEQTEQAAPEMGERPEMQAGEQPAAGRIATEAADAATNETARADATEQQEIAATDAQVTAEKTQAMPTGGMGNNASSTVNFPIDTPLSGVSMEDREIFAALLEDETYLAQYHAYYQQLIDHYIGEGGLDAFYNDTRSKIDGLVENDPTAFYSYEEYDEAAGMLYDLLLLRFQSVAGQLDGSIPSTTEGQTADASALIDSSEIDMEVMGSMNMGGGAMAVFREESETESAETIESSSESSAQQAEPAANEEQKSMGAPPQGFGDRVENGMFPTGMAESAQTDYKTAALYYGGSLLLILIVFLVIFAYRRKPYQK